MKQTALLSSLDRYSPSPEEVQFLRRLREFVLSTPDCFERTHLAGHVTGSACVVDATYRHVLLTLHGKLNKWLQLGGHSDGDPDTPRVALREATEESGIEGLHFSPELGENIFDIDIHEIPARAAEPTHLHYDVRYLIVAPAEAEPKISSESKALRWITIDDAPLLTQERSMQRQFEKIASLRSR